MNIDRVAKRYTKALFEIALEKKQLESIKREMEFIAGCYKASPELNEVLVNPVVPPVAKKAVVKDLFYKHIDITLQRFIDFLCHRKRIDILYGVALLFLDMEKRFRGIVEARLETAMTISAEQVGCLCNGLNKKFNKTFVISTALVPSLIGGFRLMIYDKVYDFSIKYHIKKLEETFKG